MSSETANERLSLWSACAWIVVFGLIAAVQLYPIGWKADVLPDDPDALHSAWLLSWLARTLPSDPLGVLHANVYHPDTAALTYSEPSLSQGLLAWPAYVLTGDAVATYGWTLIATLALSAFTTLLLVRELTGSTVAGAVAGEIFALTTANIDGAPRMQLVAAQWAPLTLFFLIRTLRRRRWRDGIACGVSFGLQGLACSYYEVFFAVLLLAMLPALLAVAPSPRLRSFPWGPLAAGALIAAVMVLPVNIEQYATLSVAGGARRNIPTPLAAYWQALPGNWLYGALLGAKGVGYDKRYFPGFASLVLGAAGAIALARSESGANRDSRRMVAPILWMGGVAFLLAFGDRVPTPWGSAPGPLAALGEWVPGLAATRLPSRFIVFVRLSLAVLAGVGLTALLPWLRARARPAGAALLAGLVVFVPLEHFSIPLDHRTVPTGSDVPEVYRWLASQPGRPVMVDFPPFPPRLRRDESLWAYLSTFHWNPMVNGYSSFHPVHFDLVYNTLMDLPSPLAFELLRELNVELLVYHPHASRVPERVRAIERFERQLAGNKLREQVLQVASFDDAPPPRSERLLGAERVYRILPRAHPRPERVRFAGAAHLATDGWRCSSRPAHGCEQAIDGDPNTVFETGTTQRPLDHLRVLFPRPVRIRGIALLSGARSRNYPIRPELRGLVDGRWRILRHHAYTLEFLQDILCDPRRAALDLHLWRAARVEGLEVRLNPARLAFNPWTVEELRVYQ